jgi:hypothetical protein
MFKNICNSHNSAHKSKIAKEFTHFEQKNEFKIFYPTIIKK